MEKQQSRGAEQRRSKEAKEQRSKGTEIHKKTKRDGKKGTEIHKKTKRDGKKPTKKNPPLFLRSFTKQSKSIDIPILGGASARAVWILNILNPQAIWICWTPSPASKNSWTSGQGDI